MTLFGSLLRKLSLRPFGLDELGGVVRRESAEFFTLGSEERCASAGVADIASRVEGAHPVLVSTRVLRPELARQERQAFVAVTLTGRGSLGVRGFDGFINGAHSGIGLCSPPRDLCSPLG